MLAAVVRIAGVVLHRQIERSEHAAELELRAREQRHAGRVVPDGGKVITHDAGAGIGPAKTCHGLLHQLEAARLSRRNRTHDENSRSSQFDCGVLHKNLLAKTFR